MKIKRNFSLRQLLIGVAVCGAILACFVLPLLRKAALQRDILAAVTRLGGDIAYDCDVPKSEREGSVFQRLANFVGRNVAAKIVWVDIPDCDSRDELHELLRHLSELRSVQDLFVSSPAINDETIRLIGGIERLEFLSIDGGRQLDISPLRNLSKLKTLCVPWLHVSRESLQALAGVPQLETIDLSFSDLNDEIIGELRSCPQLKELDITCTPVTSAGLLSLRGARSLESVTASAGLADGDVGDAAMKAQMPGIEFKFD